MMVLLRIRVSVLNSRFLLECTCGGFPLHLPIRLPEDMLRFALRVRVRVPFQHAQVK